MKIIIVAALLLSSLPAEAQSEGLGRLFFTPQQRLQLERQRQQNLSANDAPTASYTLNGEVRRSSGKNTHWVNGIAQTTPAPHGVMGDTYHPASGERDNLLGSGHITIQRQSPKP